MMFRECGEILNGKRIEIEVLYLPMLYGSETGCLGENDLTVLTNMVKAMCGVKLIQKKEN